MSENGRALSREVDGGGTLKAYLLRPVVQAKLAEAAGRAVRPDDLVRLALMAASRNRKLAECSPESVLRALLDAATLGIRPGGIMGRGFLVPRWNKYTRAMEANFDPGWRGLVDIARRSGLIRSVEAHVVFQKDVFTLSYEPETRIVHVPSEDPHPGDVRAAWAVARLTSGEAQIEVMFRRDLDKIRALGADAGPWVDWYDEMARKSVVRRLCKYLPYHPDLDEAVRLADAADPVDFSSRSAAPTTAHAPAPAAPLPAFDAEPGLPAIPAPEAGLGTAGAPREAPPSEPHGPIPDLHPETPISGTPAAPVPAPDDALEAAVAEGQRIIDAIHAADTAEGLRALSKAIRALPESVQPAVRDAYTARGKALRAARPGDAS